MALQNILLINFASIAVAITVLWLVSVISHDASVVDLFWGAGFVLTTWLSTWTSSQLTNRSILLLAMVSIWGLRLTGYLAWRNLGKPEDYRYAAMRVRHGKRFAFVSLLTVFGLQGLLMWVISLPIQVGMSVGEGTSLHVSIGLCLWGCGLFFESVGDFQLARFKADPKNSGQVMNRGLWRYTRHPNYFGDFLVWWGFYAIAADSDSWWWTVIGPLVMSFLLIRVSGVRLLESSLIKRVSGYDDYVRSTSSFFPLPPKRL